MTLAYSRMSHHCQSVWYDVGKSANMPMSSCMRQPIVIGGHANMIGFQKWLWNTDLRPLVFDGSGIHTTFPPAESRAWAALSKSLVYKTLSSDNGIAARGYTQIFQLFANVFPALTVNVSSRAAETLSRVSGISILPAADTSYEGKSCLPALPRARIVPSSLETVHFTSAFLNGRSL